jgi:hypothetical protein
MRSLTSAYDSRNKSIQKGVCYLCGIVLGVRATCVLNVSERGCFFMLLRILHFEKVVYVFLRRGKSMYE